MAQKGKRAGSRSGNTERVMNIAFEKRRTYGLSFQQAIDAVAGLNISKKGFAKAYNKWLPTAPPPLKSQRLSTTPKWYHDDKLKSYTTEEWGSNLAVVSWLVEKEREAHASKATRRSVQQLIDEFSAIPSLA